jgi:hypothetical protein
VSHPRLASSTCSDESAFKTVQKSDTNKKNSKQNGQEKSLPFKTVQKSNTNKKNSKEKRSREIFAGAVRVEGLQIGGSSVGFGIRAP